jgi:outer membrane protein OmpA-like peptidoglycan-associated protein
MSKARQGRFSAIGILLSLIATGFAPITAAQAAVPLPIAPITTFTCPDGGFYEVDALGIASRGGSTTYQDPNGLDEVGGNCTGSVVLDESVVAIQELGFESAPLTSLTLPSRLATIGRAAFAMTRLSSIRIPDSVTTIGTSAFSSVRLTSLQLGSGLTTIGSSAFTSAVLTTLDVPASVTTIGASAFRSSPLTSLTFKSPTISLGPSSFSATSGAGLACFYNLGSAPISPTNLTTAGLARACVVHNITVTVGPNGSVANPYLYIDDLATPSYQITPSAGYMIDSVSVDGSDVTDHLVVMSGETKRYVFASVTADHNMSVSFKLIPAPPAPPASPAPPSPPTSAPTSPEPVTAPSPTPTATPEPTPTPTPEPSVTPSPIPTSVPPVVAPKVIKYAGVAFAPGSASLTTANKHALNKLAGKLANASKILITGFTEGPKIAPNDVGLSRRRAMSVKKYLVTRLGKAAVVKVKVNAKQTQRLGARYRSATITVWP